MDKYPGICVHRTQDWEVIIHFDEYMYDVCSSEAADFLSHQRYQSGNILRSDISAISSGEIILKVNPAAKEAGTIDLEKVADDFVNLIILK